MIGVVTMPPIAPSDVMVMVEPVSSSRVAVPVRAASASRVSSAAQSHRSRASAWRTTGTISPAGGLRRDADMDAGVLVDDARLVVEVRVDLRLFPDRLDHGAHEERQERELRLISRFRR